MAPEIVITSPGLPCAGEMEVIVGVFDEPGGVVIVICAVPDLVGSAILVAEIETVFGLGAMPGAVYSPTALTVPTADVPPGVPLTAQVTAVLNAPVPVTMAANCCVPVSGKDAEVGLTETEVMVGGDGSGGVGGL